ncbi:ribosome biogenesis protein SLX9-domain-containing protein [Lipomyces japonicus]|uniref:ribosome biogenesis protein SLX9-domain-containing protein n=1 Tax=Lipomyces japonicus TaxID=56871 RepID=UPI0034CE76AE
MAPRRPTPSAQVEVRQALRAQSNALKLAAAKATIAKAQAQNIAAGGNRSVIHALAVKRSGKVTKKSKLEQKRIKIKDSIARTSKSTATSGGRPVLESKQPKHLTAANASRAAIETGGKDVLSSDIAQHALSKSARRRVTRKQREMVAGVGLNDLMDALPVDDENEWEDEDEMVDVDGSGNKTTSSGDPAWNVARNKPVSSKANEKIVRQEIDRFGKVITDKTFRKSPFAALRGLIQNRI